MKQELYNKLKQLDNNIISINTNVNSDVISYRTKIMKKDRLVRIGNAKDEAVVKYFNDIVVSAKEALNSRDRFFDFLQKQFDDLKVDDIVTWIEGYGCTLHQFAKVIKKTNKSVTYKHFGYRGMGCHTLPDFSKEPTGEVFVKRWGKAITELYNPNSSYDNNTD